MTEKGARDSRSPNYKNNYSTPSYSSRIKIERICRSGIRGQQISTVHRAQCPQGSADRALSTYIYSFTICKTQLPNTLSTPDMPYEFQRRLPLQQSETDSSNPSTMAASAPPPHLAAGWVDKQRCVLLFLVDLSCDVFVALRAPGQY